MERKINSYVDDDEVVYSPRKIRLSYEAFENFYALIGKSPLIIVKLGYTVTHCTQCTGPARLFSGLRVNPVNFKSRLSRLGVLPA